MGFDKSPQGRLSDCRYVERAQRAQGGQCLDDMAFGAGAIRWLGAWAAGAGIAPRTLSRRFVAEPGFTFTAWRQRVRLLRALEMLAAGQPVARVALDLGYDNVSAFIALFRHVFGITPGRYARPTGPEASP